MPALAFGLNLSKSSTSQAKPPQKRKALFDTEEHDSDDDDAPPRASTNPAKKASKPLKPLNPLQDPHTDERPHKSPRLSPSVSPANGTNTDKYTNLSALRSARLHDQAAQQLDASVYAYDAVYDTFNPASKAKGPAAPSSGPKYMTSLLTSAEQRKRDLLRAKEIVLQRERENEGEEYVGKESFVTGAYKRQQEEMRVAEEEEKRKMQEEEKLRGAGVGMLGFNREVLRKEEERMKGIEEMEVQMERRRKEGGGGEVGEDDDVAEEGDVEEKMARDLNEKGGRIVVNDEGEVVDKRQLLSAGLNVAAKKPGQDGRASKVDHGAAKPQEYQKSSQARNAREAQRERQTRMMERQIEEMTVQQEKEKEDEEKAVEEKTKSRITEDAKMSAKERYLQRKKEREQEAKKGG